MTEEIPGAVTRDEVESLQVNEAQSLGSRARSATWLALAGQVMKGVVQIISVIVLARLLSPSDFGLYGMVMATIGIGFVFKDVGLGAAAIQAKRLSHAQQSNLWWINTVLGTLVACAVAASAPLVTIFLKNDAVLPLTLALAPTFILNGMTAQYSASLVRGLRYGAQMIADIPAAAVGLVACIIAALGGLGPWALVIQSLVSGTWSLVASAVLAGWLPARWVRGQSMRELLKFGASVFGNALIFYIANNIATALIGRSFGAADTGQLTRANQLVNTPIGSLSAPFASLSLSVLSKVKDDTDELLRFALVGQQMLAYAVTFVCGVFIAAGGPIVVIALGEQWSGAASLVKLVALGTALGFLPAAHGWLFNSQGRPDAILQFNLVGATLRTVGIVIAVQFSVEAVLWWNAALTGVLCPLTFWWLHRATGLRVRELQLGALRVGLAGAFAVAASELGAGVLGLDVSPWVDISLRSSLFTAACVGTLIIPAIRRDVVGGAHLVLGRRRVTNRWKDQGCDLR